MNISEFYSAIQAIDKRIQLHRMGEPGLSESEEPHIEGKRNVLKEEQEFIEKLQGAYAPNADNNGATDSFFKETQYFHYTDLNGLLGIFKEYIEEKDPPATVRGCTMRASHIRFLNDSQEYKEGKTRYGLYLKNEGVKTAIDEYRKNNFYFSNALLGNTRDILPKSRIPNQEISEKNIFSISFCGDGDLLSQWKYYGRNSGIAIEFDFDSAECKISGDDEEKWRKICPLKTAYTDSEKLTLLAMSCLTPDSTGKLLTQYPQAEIFIPFCKNESFREEKESRLVFSPDKAKYAYVVSEGRIKPYIPVKFKAEEGHNIIKSITVGPGENQNLVYNALIHIFDSKRFCFQEDDGRRGTATKKIESKQEKIYCADCEKNTVLKETSKNQEYPYHCDNGIVIFKSAIPFRG